MSVDPFSRPPVVRRDPVVLDIRTPEVIARWRPFVQWLLAIPHLVVVALLSYASRAIAFVSWLVILFTGKLPASLAGFQCMFLRYQMRAMSYVVFLRETYPPFTFHTAGPDPGDDPPVRLDLAPVLEGRNRLTVAFRLILAIPHYIALVFVGFAAVVCVIVAAFAVLFTGSWPDGMRRFVLGAARWNVRVDAYVSLLHDEYPPFSLD